MYTKEGLKISLTLIDTHRFLYDVLKVADELNMENISVSVDVDENAVPIFHINDINPDVCREVYEHWRKDQADGIDLIEKTLLSYENNAKTEETSEDEDENSREERIRRILGLNANTCKEDSKSGSPKEYEVEVVFDKDLTILIDANDEDEAIELAYQYLRDENYVTDYVHDLKIKK